jgi:Na+-translocating ferredoxin:NAD+ oxidoreductase RnfG subunit
MKITYNQLLFLALISALGFSFMCGMNYKETHLIKSNDSEQENKISELLKENENLKIEVSGLTKLIKLKNNQNISHYSHVEVKHDFRIVNKRK